MIYRFTNRRMVRTAVRQLHRNFPDKDRLGLGIVVIEDQKILLQATLRGRTRVHEVIFMEGILSTGERSEITPEVFAKLALEAQEVYLGSAALAFPMSRPGERPGGGHARVD